jgi:hypothetical protein
MPISSLGSVTQFQAWNILVAKRNINDLLHVKLPTEQMDVKIKLASQFEDIEHANWEAEMDMYPDIIEAIQETVYSDNPCVFIVDMANCVPMSVSDSTRTRDAHISSGTSLS